MKPTLALLTALLLAPLAALHAADAPKQKPNIVVILADDLGYGDIACYGATRLRTPHIDRMAREGMRFTDFHSNGATCSPTRAALLTGRYQQRCGVEEALSEKSAGLPDEARTIAEYLQPAGYATGAFGKWHLGSKPNSAALPNRQGFDVFRGSRHGGVDYVSHVDRYGRLDWWADDKPLVEAGYATDLLTEHALQFIAQHKEEPFFLYLPHTAIHFPWMTADDRAYREVGENYDNQSKVGQHTPAKITQVVNAMIERLDVGVGRVMQAIRALPKERETLVIFTSDNGGYLRYAGGFSNISSNGVLRGQKVGMYEGGHRVPCIAWWPGRIAAGSETDATTMTMDLLPTFLECAGVAAPPAGDPWAFDGASLLPLLLRNESPRPRPLFWRSRGMKAVRQGPWKLVIEHDGPPSLFHLGNDLSEKRDLAAAEPQQLQELLDALAKWESQFSPRPVKRAPANTKQ